ncbi:transposase [Pseudomonas sp. PA-7-1E]|uniref:Transposase n=1 Tax=Pseudomonas proteolytica TaxID=219574 RepID=A0AAW5A4I8_9PSED|nr:MULTISPECIES: transposase [Pseudomonas]MBU0526653.1 transposase [Gammaproteobacteria bacterium]MBM3113522.1 transposase [Pseudomonas arcuscaelestis]MBU0817422.1 transposase [Gammaproteobacteria bacterium]MBU0845166.1 transposase [Gammaproteobacteria bacterium]MBU1839903.1 transposase [Gammaproteobacteria bacterium]
MTRRSFSSDFKLEAAGLVLDQGYSIPEACKSMGVGKTALRRWVERNFANEELARISHEAARRGR